MAEYRPIKTKIWNDSWFMSLNPQEKLVWIFLLTNDYVHISGIYEFHFELIRIHTGVDDYEKILKKFEKADKIRIKDNWIFIKNYLKNQSNQILKQTKKKDNILKSIVKYLEENIYLIDYFDLAREDPFKPLIDMIKPLVRPLPKEERGKSKQETGNGKEEIETESTDDSNKKTKTTPNVDGFATPYDDKNLSTKINLTKTKRGRMINIYNLQISQKTFPSRAFIAACAFNSFVGVSSGKGMRESEVAIRAF